MTDLAVSALSRKRAELAGEILDLEKKLEAVRSKLLHLDAIILLFDPHHAIEAITPKRPANGVELFKNGELFADVQRRVGKALRKKACGVLRRVQLDGWAIGWSVGE
jgi:hypothetical protein